MKVKLSMLVAAIALVAVVVASNTDVSAEGGGRGNGPIIYVRSQGLYYDSIITADPIPAKGSFQLLEMGPNGLETDFGPGDRGYLGGRWMEDFGGTGTFHYFSCPLLGPGRTQP